MSTTANLNLGDWLAIVAYLIIVFLVGIWASCCNRGSVGGYFLGGRNLHWIIIGASLFATNVGSGHFIGLAGAGASNGLAVIAFEFNAIFVLLLLGWIFLPVYIAAGVYTMPEYLKLRFGGRRIQMLLSALSLLLYVIMKISTDLYAGAIFIDRAANIDLYPAVIILLAISGIFTVIGGLTAVMWTDFVQTIIMILGAAFLMVVSFIKVGGYAAIWELYPHSSPNTTRLAELLTSSPGAGRVPWTFAGDGIEPSFNASYVNSTVLRVGKCGTPNPIAFHIVRPADDDAFPWPGVLIGALISSIWHWCSDQVFVQRVLAARSLLHAKLGCVLGGYLKVTPLFLILLPGMIARVLYTDRVACVEPAVCQRFCAKGAAGCWDYAYLTLLLELLPTGMRGIMIAVALSALVSSLTSVFNSASTIFTMDIWRFFRKKASEIELLVVGRLFIVVVVALSVMWIPIVKSGSELFVYTQRVTAFIAPPVCALYLLAVLWPRCTEIGAFAMLVVGLVVGLSRFVLEIIFTSSSCGEENTSPDFISKVHYLHFAMGLFALSITIGVLLHRLVFWSRFSTEERSDIEEWHRTINFLGCSRRGAVAPVAVPVTISSLSSDYDSMQPAKLPVPDYDHQPQESREYPVARGDSINPTKENSEPPPAYSPTETKPTVRPPLWKRALYFVCGMEELLRAESELSYLEKRRERTTERETVDSLLALLKESPTEMLLGYANLLAVIFIGVALFVYYA